MWTIPFSHIFSVPLQSHVADTVYKFEAEVTYHHHGGDNFQTELELLIIFWVIFFCDMQDYVPVLLIVWPEVSRTRNVCYIKKTWEWGFKNGLWKKTSRMESQLAEGWEMMAGWLRWQSDTKCRQKVQGWSCQPGCDLVGGWRTSVLY